jgi:signal transduction histidine kinase
LFRITARTVLELGAELISSDIIAFYELIKNGFDAGTKNGVEIRFDIVLPRHLYIKLRDVIVKAIASKAPPAGALDQHRSSIIEALLPDSQGKLRSGFIQTINAAGTLIELQRELDRAQARYNRISVIDTGSGMSIDDLEKNFLVIGTASRKREVEKAIAAGAKHSPYLGEKGIGRLSAMRLGEYLQVRTARAEDLVMNRLDINWRDFARLDAMLDDVPVKPNSRGEKPSTGWSGTTIIVRDLVENWTSARVAELCDYDFARLTDPFAEPESRPRIAIFWNGQRQSIPIMPRRLLDAAHARVIGNYKIEDGKPLLSCTVDIIDLGFPHPPESETVVLTLEDLEGAIIGKDGEIDDTALVEVGPFSFEAYWFNRRRLSRVDTTGENMTIRDMQEQWSGILLFRDRYRVFPYGEDEDDWLELDRRALRRSGYTLNKTQFIGRVEISRAGNPDLVDQTNREGLRETPAQQVLLRAIRSAIQDRLGGFMQDVERQYKGQRIDLTEAKTRVAGLEDRARSSIKRLRRVAKGDDRAAVDELEQTLLELSDFAAKARERITEVEEESRRMIDMAGVGLMVEVVAHELARSSENALKALDRLRSADLPDQVRAHLNTLRAEMRSVSKRVRVLDPLSVSGRQRSEAFALDAMIREQLEGHVAQFERHNIHLKLDLPKRPLMVRAVKGMIVQILENLISNSIYWIEIRAARERTLKPEIRITLENGPPTLTYEDNGRGVAPSNADKIFRPFWSLKERKARRGLGLFIAREAAERHKGSLVLSDHVDLVTGRLHRFILELPGDSET